MRIVFDVTSCARESRGGISTYGWNLVEGCARVAPDNEYVLAVRSNRWTRRKLIAGLLPNAPRRALVDGLQWFTLGRPVDVFHGVGIRLPAVARFPKTVMMHDLNVFEFPELSSESWRVSRQQRIRETVARADLVISYSEQGRDALGHYVDCPPEKVRVVPLAVDTDVFRRPPEEQLQRVLAKHGLAERPYLICVGQYDGRKNHDGLLEAFAHAKLPEEWVLVLGGPKNENADKLRARGRELGVPDDRLHLPGFVLEDELPALLAGAEFYACGSLHEGFGLPVIEAQACGTAVVSSNRAALVETLGDCGLLFDPADLDDFASALQRMAGDAELRADFAARGPQRVAEHYTWDTLARASLDVFAEAAAR
ncbi:MAG: glycosyl transferase family 1 [Planctomycetota bacterium]|nr:MAG: glycosyl transferase family 1 [Planctomycetota bacterium]